MDPATMAMLAGAAGKAIATPPAGPSSAMARSDSAQHSNLDGSNWNVNYGGAQVAGGTQWLLIGGAVLVAVWMMKKR